MIVMSMLLSGCGGSNANVLENKVEVTIPANTFLEPTEVSLMNADSISGYSEEEMEVLVAPIAILVGVDSVRLEQADKITTKYDAAMPEDNYESGELYIGYFNGSEWEYMKTEVDRENNTMWFYTSHFSPFGAAKLKLDKRIDEYVSNQAAGYLAEGRTKDAAKIIGEHLAKFLGGDIM
jgi:hypothetical protein